MFILRRSKVTNGKQSRLWRYDLKENTDTLPTNYYFITDWEFWVHFVFITFLRDGMGGQLMYFVKTVARSVDNFFMGFRKIPLINN